MFKTGVAGAMVLAAAVAASAQTPRPGDDAVRARQRISMMEGVLERAVQNGADNLLQEVRKVAPGADGFMLMGVPQVRGFRLQPYGVFFDVQVPGLRVPLAWTLRYLADDNAQLQQSLLELRATLQGVPDGAERRAALDAVRQIERRLGPSPISVRRESDTRPAAPQVVSSAVPAVPPPSPVDSHVLEDPQEAYTREVKNAIVDAMIENTGGLVIGPDEFVAVAARDTLGADRLVVGDASDSHTILFRLKGSDLTAFRSGTISLEEARTRVQITED